MRLPLLALSLALLSAGPALAAPSAWCSAPSAPDPVIQSLLTDAGKRLPGSPRAIPRIHTEGTLPHQGIWDASMEAKKDHALMQELAMAWRVTHDKVTLAQLAAVLDAWATVYQPSFNPIDETGFDTLIDAYAITRAELPSATRDKVAAMLRGWSEGYLREMRRSAGVGKGTWVNNWQSHRIKLMTLAAVALDDAELFDAARFQFLRQLNQNLRPDGHSLDFEERDALHYTVYDLEPLLRAAMAARLRGEDWLHLKADNGVTLAAGLDWLLPYARGEQPHEEYVHTKVKFDLQRRDAGVHGFSGPWEPKSASRLYWQAATLDARYLPVAQALGQEPLWIAACWQLKPSAE